METERSSIFTVVYDRIPYLSEITHEHLVMFYDFNYYFYDWNQTKTLNFTTDSYIFIRRHLLTMTNNWKQ